jgi:hypothetical protein
LHESVATDIKVLAGDQGQTNPRSGMDGERSEAARSAKIDLIRSESLELPTRGSSERQVVDSIHIYQLVTGTSVS